MEIGIVLGILGVLATVIFGSLSIHLYFKRRYSGQITFVVENCMGLFESIVKHFPELSVSYKNSPVGEGLVLLKGALVNTGTKDITKEMVEDKLRLVLPERYKWLQSKVVSNSPSVRGYVEQGPQALTFDIGLFRCQEFVQFECLAEVPIPDDGTTSMEARLLDELDVTHRIADTQKVRPVHLRQLEKTGRRKKEIRIFPLSILSGMIVALAVLFFIEGVPVPIHYHVANDNGGRVEVTAEPKENGDVLIKGVKQTSFEKRIPAIDFFRTPGLEPRVVPDRWAKYRAYGLLLLSVTILSGNCLAGVGLWIWRAEEVGQEGQRLLLALDACGEQAGEDFLGAGPGGGPIAAEDLAVDHCRADGLFGGPVGGLDRRVVQKGQDFVSVFAKVSLESTIGLM